MGVKKIILLIISAILVISVIVINVMPMQKESKPELSYDIMKEEHEEWDFIIQKQEFLKSTQADDRYAAVIIYHGNEAQIQQYLIENNRSINITVPEDSKYIISLPANSTVAYSWNIENEINDRILAFDQLTQTENPIPIKDIGKVGVSYARQNFYFHSNKAGRAKLVMRYDHLTEQREDAIEVTFRIKIR